MDRISDFELKLMTIDAERLSVPETGVSTRQPPTKCNRASAHCLRRCAPFCLPCSRAEYKATVRMPASEFQRIVRDLMVLGDTCAFLTCPQYPWRMCATATLHCSRTPSCRRYCRF